MDVSAPGYATEYDVDTAEVARASAAAAARSSGTSGSASGGSSKALPSPGEVLRLNAEAQARGEQQPAAAAPKKVLSAREQQDKEIQDLIREDMARERSEKALRKAKDDAKESGKAWGKGGGKKRKRKAKGGDD